MVEFDDVLAMDASDDWGDYAAAGGAPADRGAAPLVASGHIRGARIRLRGQIPSEVLLSFRDLVRERPIVPSADRPPATDCDAVTADDLAGFDGNDDEIDVDVVLDSDHTLATDDLVDAATASIVGALKAADRIHVHLDAALLAMDGDPRRGLLLLHPAAAVRDRLTSELAAEGASPISAADVMLVPGTRTVFGVPLPIRLDAGIVALSTLGAVLDHALIERVVIIDTDEGPAGVVAVDPADGIAEWLDVDRELIVRHGPGVLDPIVAAVAAASFRKVRADSVDDYVEAILAPAEVPDPADVLLHRFDLPAAGEGDAALGGPAGSLRVARIGDRGVLADGGSGVTAALDATEIDALEVLATADPGRGRASTVADIEGSLGRIRDLGVDLSIVRGRRSSPDARYLPNSAREPGSGSRSATTPAAVDALVQFLDLCDSVDARPIVLGSMLLAHDSTAPATVIDVDSVDALLAKDDLEHIVEVLQTAGYRVVRGASDVDETDGPANVVLQPPNLTTDGTRSGLTVEINLQTLLPVGHFSELVDLDAVRRRSIPVLVRDRWCNGLHPVDRFILVCSQSVQRGGGIRRSREVVLTAPRLEPVMIEALEASDRWGTTRDVLAAVRDADRELPGISPWLVDRATRYDTDRRSRRARRRR